MGSELKLRSSGLRAKHFTNWAISSDWGIIILIKHNKNHCFVGDGPPCRIARGGLEPVLFPDLLSRVRSLPNRRELPLQDAISVSENMCWFYIWYLVILQTALGNSTSWCKILQVTMDKLLRSLTIWPPRHKPSLAEAQLRLFIRVLCTTVVFLSTTADSNCCSWDPSSTNPKIIARWPLRRDSLLVLSIGSNKLN